MVWSCGLKSDPIVNLSLIFFRSNCYQLYRVGLVGIGDFVTSNGYILLNSKFYKIAIILIYPTNGPTGM